VYQRIKILFQILVSCGIIVILFSCNNFRQDADDIMPGLHPPPRVVELNTDNGYVINQLSGDSIQPLVNSYGDTIITGVPFSLKGKTVDPKNISPPEIVKTSFSNKPAASIRKTTHYPKVIPVDKNLLKTFTPGVDTNSFVLVNTYGDTIPTGKHIPVKQSVTSWKQSPPVKAFLPRMNDNAKINLHYLDVGQGMNSSNISSLLEDRNGNIWIGTWGGGVSRYDGESFTHFTIKNGLTINLITSLFEDSKGNIWIGTYDKGVSMFDGDSFTHFRLMEGLIDLFVTSILEDRKGNIWFCTSGGGASMYDGESIIHYTRKEGMKSNYVNTVVEDKYGILWFGTREGLCSYNGESFTCYPMDEMLSQLHVTSGIEDSKGNLWFGTLKGVIMYNHDSFIIYTEKEGLTVNSVSSVSEDKNGRLWFGTYRNGVSMFHNNTFTNLTKDKGLTDNKVSCILEDSYGNLWFGTASGGVNIYQSQSFIHFTKEDGLGEGSASTILEDHHGNMWFGTIRSPGVNMYDGVTFSYYSQNEVFGNRRVNTIYEDSQGNIWFGTEGHGVIKYDGSVSSYYSEKQGLSSKYVYTVIEDDQGNIWFGTWSGGLTVFNGKQFTHLTEATGFCDNIVLSSVKDSDGNLWFGTWSKGIAVYDGVNFTYLSEKEGLTNNTIFCLYNDSHNHIWIATDGGGLLMFDGKAFLQFTEREGLSSNYIYSIAEDHNNNIWINTLKGMDCLVFPKDKELPPKSSSSDLTLQHCTAAVTPGFPDIYNYSTLDGLIGLFSAEEKITVDSRNYLWTGTTKSIMQLNLNHFRIPDKPPKLQLNRLDINGAFTDFRSLSDSAKASITFTDVARFGNYPLNLELSHKQNNITFHFSAIDWSAPHKILYSYKMEGLNSTWSHPEPVTRADYRSLPHGHYTFKLKAIGPSNEWSDTLEYSFRIRPPWYHTWLARIVFGMIGVFLVYLIVLWRTARLKRHKKELEQTVRERTIEIYDMNEELRQQNDELASQRDEIETQRNRVTEQNEQIRSQQESITASIRYASKIQNAMLPPEEVIKYLLPKHFILYKPRDIVSGDFYWLGQKEDKIIIAVTDCTGHGVSGAFMSMLGSALLNEIINSIEDLQANLILNELRDQVMVSLRQTGTLEETKDGMDIALCILDRNNMLLQYAGGNNPLYIIRNNELIEVKPDLMPIGISSSAGKSFTNHEVPVRKGDALYMFSDGYADQFGGPDRKKFMISRFKKLLLDIQNKIMFEQKEILEHTLNDWMGLTGKSHVKHEQLDDITVMGIKI
jgi:ligand-binding sensor domain-containing protein/serine phosphatase RsbU (regulator of sigma subunit)